MRTPDSGLRQALTGALRGRQPPTTAELSRLLGVTRQTVHRLLAEIDPDLLFAAGSPRRMRYALRRSLRGKSGELPLFAIDADGHGEQLSAFSLVGTEGSFLALQGTAWPSPVESKDGWWQGLPYPLHAMRPMGYMGRLLARAEHRRLEVSDNPDQWSDDDVAWVLSRCGDDVTGNLVLGAPAYEAWLRTRVAEGSPPGTRQLAKAYARLADQAVAGVGGGSSAAGEFPKFTTTRDLSGAITPHVLVKFSGASRTASERRWADLLVCEHLALECVRGIAGLQAARSRIIEHSGRVFLETERFDRVGQHGRRPVCALDSIDAAFIGSAAGAWPIVAARMRKTGLIDAEAVTAIERLWWFGRLIANSDMHFGNVTFFVRGTFSLAPAYDMLPMAYAPLAGGEVASREFRPDLPLPAQRSTWLASCAAAIDFWDISNRDSRISSRFRSVCRQNANHLRSLADRV